MVAFSFGSFAKLLAEPENATPTVIGYESCDRPSKGRKQDADEF
jgi:hypothetical protein